MQERGFLWASPFRRSWSSGCTLLPEEVDCQMAMSGVWARAACRRHPVERSTGEAQSMLLKSWIPEQCHRLQPKSLVMSAVRKKSSLAAYRAEMWSVQLSVQNPALQGADYPIWNHVMKKSFPGGDLPSNNISTVRRWQIVCAILNYA